jgi:N-glycosylase/DNA lyase
VILQQDLWETIVSFIVSQRKSIPAIKSSLEKLRRTFGQRCEVHLPDDSIIEYYTFPSPQDILYHEVTADDINKACGVGYRAEYILDAARWFLDYEYHTLDLGNSYEEHLSALKEIKGVGDKVANCICLFSLGDLNSFPIDVWIQRALDKELFTLEEVDDLEYRGFIQQVIFFYIINHKEEFV